jgi:hypothetical protein
VTDKFHLHPWSDLTSRQPPESLIPGLIPKRGVTTMFAQRGWAKPSPQSRRLVRYLDDANDRVKPFDEIVEAWLAVLTTLSSIVRDASLQRDR